VSRRTSAVPAGLDATAGAPGKDAIALRGRRRRRGDGLCARFGRINDLGGTPSTDYYHTDMLGTTRFLTDASGGEIEPAVYTAFGELVSGTLLHFMHAWHLYGQGSYDNGPDDDPTPGYELPIPFPEPAPPPLLRETA